MRASAESGAEQPGKVGEGEKGWTQMSELNHGGLDI